MMSYDVVNFTGMTGLIEFVNTTTDGLFGFLIPPFIFLGLLFGFMRLGNKTTHSALAASFVTVLAAIVLNVIDIVGDTVLTAWLAVFLIALVGAYLEGK